MDRFSKYFCDPVKIVKNVLMVLLFAGVLVYVYLQTVSGFDSGLETETAMLVRLNDDVDAEAYIFRDETVIKKENDGAIVTLVSEGDRVSKGQLLANVYSDSTDTVLQDEINRIQRRLDILEDSKIDSEYVISDLAEIDKDISDVLSDIYKGASEGDLSSAIENSSDFLVKLNKRDLIIDSEFDYSEEQERLIKEKNSIESRINSLSSGLTATSSGYFYGDVDGYEEIFDIDKVEGITLNNFDEFTGAVADSELLKSGAVKIVNDFVWYVVCSINADDMAGISEGNSYVLSFPENADKEIRMKLTKIISETSSARTLAVFRVNVLPSDFNYKRSQSAKIVLDNVEGLSVPKKALRVIDGVNGVYVLVGDVVRFRRVEIIDETEGYYICDYKTSNKIFEELENEQDESLREKLSEIKYLSLYDNVIVSGKDLFDGKIIG